MKLALISLNQIWEDKVSNLQRCEELASLGAEVGAELVIFPEMTLTGFSMNIQKNAEDAQQSPTVRAFSAMANKFSIAIVVGITMRAGTQALNTLVAFDNEGVEKARYVKIHPFSIAGEDKFFQRGELLSKTDLVGFRLGFSICYDLRFPELYTALAKDCDMLINIANWPRKRESHWKTLLKARAIENQVFVVGVNRTGNDGNGLEYLPSSCVVSADGEILQPYFSGNEIDVYEISRCDLYDFRKIFSTIKDRRPDLYRDII